MIQLDSILVIADPTVQSQPAIDTAARLAQACGARLDLYACETRESRSLRHNAARAAGKAALPTEVWLQSLSQPLLDRGLTVRVETAAGDPLHAMVLERARRGRVSLVVKDTHHHSLAKRTFLTNTDWELIRGCAAPLLLVKPEPWRAAPAFAAAIDPGHSDDRTEALDQQLLAWTCWLAQRVQGSAHAVHAFLPLEAADTDPGSISVTEAAQTARAAALAAFVQSHGIDAAHLHLELGVASEVLPSIAAQLRLDVLIMGAISRSGLARLFIGSTAERVLEQLPCDVLIVKPVGFVPPAA